MACRSPSVPLQAAWTAYPAVSSARLMKSRIRGSSSTSRMREPATASACSDAAIDSRVISPYPPPQLTVRWGSSDEGPPRRGGRSTGLKQSIAKPPLGPTGVAAGILDNPSYLTSYSLSLRSPRSENGTCWDCTDDDNLVMECPDCCRLQH